MKARMFLLALEIRSKAAGAGAVSIKNESSGGRKAGEKPSLAWAVDFLNRLPKNPNDRKKILFFYMDHGRPNPNETKAIRREFWAIIRRSGLWGEGVPMVCRSESE